MSHTYIHAYSLSHHFLFIIFFFFNFFKHMFAELFFVFNKLFFREGVSGMEFDNKVNADHCFFYLAF